MTTLENKPSATKHHADMMLRPRLSREMLSRVRRYADPLSFSERTQLYEIGARHWDFFVVEFGELEISVGSPSGNHEVIYCHTDGEFSGNTYLLTDRAMLVGLSAGPNTKLLRIRREKFRSFLAGEPEIADIVLQTFMYRCMNLVARSEGGVLVVGSTSSREVLRLRRFLDGNHYPHRLLDPDLEPEAEGIIAAMSLTRAELPVVLSSSLVLRTPTNAELAGHLGLFEPVDVSDLCDVAVIGAGPGGLAAAVYAASEGLHTVVIEGQAPGGQAGTSSRIENYLGFPTGISGSDLASLAQAQVQKFGGKLVVSQNVVLLDCSVRPFEIHLSGGSCIRAKSVVVATGARYRRLNLPNQVQYEMDGIHYAATSMEAQVCKDKEVIIVGGGNSAGQAAMFMSKFANRVHMVIRGYGLSSTMSEYLSSRIEKAEKVSLYPRCEMVELNGDEKLRYAVWRCMESEKITRIEAPNIFVMIGADPRTELLREPIKLDDKGFVLTGGLAGNKEMAYATSVDGVFAVGDVRAGSIKRVASAVGEGSVVIAMVHAYLSTLA